MAVVVGVAVGPPAWGSRGDYRLPPGHGLALLWLWLLVLLVLVKQSANIERFNGFLFA